MIIKIYESDEPAGPQSLVGTLTSRGSAVVPVSGDVSALNDLLAHYNVFDPALGRCLDPRTDGNRYLTRLAAQYQGSCYSAVVG